MGDTAALLILLSGLTHAIVNAILKAGADKMSGRALIDGFSALMLAPLAFIVPLPTHAWGWLLGSWITHAVYLLALIKAFEQADMTVAYPVARGIAPVAAAATSVLAFGEPASRGVVVGIALIAAGVALIGLGRAVRLRSLGWAILTGLSIASYTVIDAQGVRAAPDAPSYIVWTFLMMGGGIGMGFAFWRGRAFVAAAARQWKPGLLAGLLSIVTYGSALWAFRLGATPRLAALRETSILFATLIAVVFLKERLSRGRGLGVGCIAMGAGVLLLSR